MPELRPKQIEQLSYYIAHPKCLDLSDPGTGKTPPCCMYAYWMWARNQQKTLWTMPKSLRKKNKSELLLFTGFAPEDVVILTNDRANLTDNWDGPTITGTRKRRGFLLKDGTNTVDLRDASTVPLKFVWEKDGEWFPLGKSKPLIGEPHVDAIRVTPLLGPDGEPQPYSRDDEEVFKDLIAANAHAKVFICTFRFGATHWQRLFEVNPEIDLLLVDELHMGYGGPNSELTESFYWINRNVNRFVGMTGTLINGRLDSAFPAIHVIEPNYYGSFNGFMFDHAAMTDDYGRVIIWKNEDKVQKILDRHSIRRTFEEVYGKEDVVFFVENLEIGDEVKVKYDEFHEKAMLELEDGRVLDGTLPGVNLIRARQLLSHPETMLKGIPKWTPKDERIETILSQGKKTIIFASLQPEQERLLRLCRDELGLRAEMINGNVSGPQRDKIDAMAQRHELDVIIASGPTAAVGFNWEMFDIVVFASIDYLDVNVLQAYRRASRGTRTSTLRVIFLRYQDSVERKVFEIVKKKSQLANRVDATRPVLEFENWESGTHPT
jgi:hypothetical protein